MRDLAGQLGYGVLSLYNHVGNKDEMLDGMIDLVAGEIEAPIPRNGDWICALRVTAVSARKVGGSSPSRRAISTPLRHQSVGSSCAFERGR